ncbi:MAG: HAD-IIB family hydrolase [Gammaproteobacteria bacterium]
MEEVSNNGDGKYLLLISVHGLLRGQDPELGRDADTGGQIKYVVELARALAADPRVAQVDLLTRRVVDAKVSADYAEREEWLAPGARIVRLDCGPQRYLRKETLWPYLDSFVDAAVRYISQQGRTPDAVHSHYADAGYVGTRLAALLGVPLIHTGHSLGRVKRQRLLEKGESESVLESKYNLSQRIEAEEATLDNAAFVVASTQQEVDEQYALYDNYNPRRIFVIPPGVELERFSPPKRPYRRPPIYRELERFLREPRRPMILALSRADERKNIATLVRAYAEHPTLRHQANLVIVAGNRDDIGAMEKGPKQVLTDLLMAIDRYDLYGCVAYPKHHEPEDVADLYRLAAYTRGIFVNPALTEPFGLTLIEAAASGLPVLATADGGPRDILGHCRNGRLIDPLDAAAMGRAIEEALKDKSRWRRWSRNGIRGAQRHYTWQGHVDRYLRTLERFVAKPGKRRRLVMTRSRLPEIDRLLVCDIDNTLIGDPPGLEKLIERLHDARGRLGFAIATGRRIDSARKVLKEWHVPMPDILITAVGSEIHYGHYMVEDSSWSSHIDYRWQRRALMEAMADVPGIRMQSASEQRRHKISYHVDPDILPPLRDIRRHLRQRDLHANVIYSHNAYLDLLPLRASKGLAIRYLSVKWGLPPERILVAGDSGNDEEMLRGEMLGVVVGNFSKELLKLRGQPRILFADNSYAWGVIEALDYYQFLGQICTHDEELTEDLDRDTG